MEHPDRVVQPVPWMPASMLIPPLTSNNKTLESQANFDDANAVILGHEREHVSPFEFPQRVKREWRS